MVCCQGDQIGQKIGRISARWVIVFWAVFRKVQKNPELFVCFFHGKSEALIPTKKSVGPSFWAIFSKTHLVTLFVVVISTMGRPTPIEPIPESKLLKLLTKEAFLRDLKLLVICAAN
jgi:hypothetical protein